MSGSAGGNRIPRSAVEKTVQEYIDKVLSKIEGFKSAKVSGSYNTSAKQDFGDIDLITSFQGEDKKEFKKTLAKYLESLPDDIIVPFKSEKYKGKKSLNTGEIVTILYPIVGMPGEFVQIDNIIALSEEEGEFKKTFLDYPAEVQGLILGLVKVVLLEEDPKSVLKRMGITNIPPLDEGQEYEFNLSSAGLTLRVVTLDENFKQIDRTEVWKSSSWSDVKKLLFNFNLDLPFEKLLDSLKGLKNERSKNRIKGIFKSMVSIKSGEVGTPKGDNKQYALDKVAALEEKYGALAVSLIRPILEAESKETVAIYPGGFKPPHKGHLQVIQSVAPKVDKMIVIYSTKTRQKPGQVPITAEQTANTFQLYIDNGLIPGNVEIRPAETATPVQDAYEIMKANPNNNYMALYGKDEEGAWKSIEKYKQQGEYLNVVPTSVGNFGGLNATAIRTALQNNDMETLKQSLPVGITVEEYTQALGITPEPVQETYKGKRTNQGAPGTLKAKISKLYGGDVTIEKARKLKNRENATAHDKRQANWFINFHSKNENIEPAETSGQAAPYGSGYKKLEEELTPLIVELTQYMYKQGLSMDPAPSFEFIEDESNAQNPLGRTAYYDPNNQHIVLYITGRHPKDILRSFAHEMIHHAQNLEGRLANLPKTTDINEDDHLKEIEREAYETGNLLFRGWENNRNKQVMAEGKYDTLSNKLSSKIFAKWKSDFEAGKPESHFEWFVMDEKTGLDFDLKADIEFVDQDIYSVDGGANQGSDYEDALIQAEFIVDKQALPQYWEKISFDLKDFMRHEIEHLTQAGVNLISSKKRNSDQARRDKIKAGELPTSKYATLKSEIEPMLQGMYFSAKKQRRPFRDVVEDWFDSRGFTNPERVEILKTWKPYLKRLSLPNL